MIYIEATLDEFIRIVRLKDVYPALSVIELIEIIKNNPPKEKNGEKPNQSRD